VTAARVTTGLGAGRDRVETFATTGVFTLTALGWTLGVVLSATLTGAAWTTGLGATFAAT
jgi:hypothetical protein